MDYMKVHLVYLTMTHPKVLLVGFYLLLMQTGLGFCEYQSYTLAFMENWDSSTKSCGYNVTMFLAAAEMTECSVSAPNLSERKYTVNPSDIIEVNLPRSVAMSGSGVQCKGIAVFCNTTIRLYGINACEYNTDGFSVIPNSLLGREYYAFTVSPTDSYSQVAVVSYLDNTAVTVYLRCTDCNVTMDTVEYTTGSNITLVLDEYECLQIQSGGNLAGTYISSSNPVSVFSGNIRSGINGGARKEHLVLHVPPIKSWGKQFVVVSTPFSTLNTISDCLFVMTSTNFTSVNIQCTRSSFTVQVDSAGKIIQHDIESNDYCSIETNEAVLAVQIISNGDRPSFLPLTPIDQYSTNYSFKTPKTSIGNGFINYFVYVIEKSAASDLMLDSQAIPTGQHSFSKFSNIPGTALRGGYISVTDNSHRVTHPYAQFSGAILGLDSRRESYAITLGYNWKDSNSLLSSDDQTSQDTIITQTANQITTGTTGAKDIQRPTNEVSSTSLASKDSTKQMSSSSQDTQGKKIGATTTVQAASQHVSTDMSTAVQATQDTRTGASSTVHVSQFTNKATYTEATEKQLTNIPSSTSTGGRSKPVKESAECRCPCSLVSTKWQNLLKGISSKEELVRLVLNDFEQNIKPDLMINRKKLSKLKRKKISVMNTDPTENRIGWGFSWIVVIPVVVAVLSDMLNLRRHNRIAP